MQLAHSLIFIAFYMLIQKLICAIIFLSWQTCRFFCVYSQNYSHKLTIVERNLYIRILWKHKISAVCQDAERM